MGMIELGATPSNWHLRIAKFLQEQVRVAKSIPSPGPHQRSHISSLEALACYLFGGIGADDPRTGLFLKLFLLTGRGPNGQTYEPSPTARKLLNGLGKRGASGGATENSLDVLLELAAVEIGDFHGQAQGDKRRAAVAEQKADAAELKAAEFERANIELRDEVETTAARLLSVGNELADERERSAHLQGLLAALGGEPESKTKDRKAVPGHENIYSRVRADGETIYQVGWREDGRQRWHATGPKLDDAIAFRDGQLAAAAERQKLEADAAREQVEAAA